MRMTRNTEFYPLDDIFLGGSPVAISGKYTDRRAFGAESRKYSLERERIRERE